MIEIDNLSKSYGGKQVLNGISAKFEPGKVYGIVGENGAGKTTLFRCLAGLEDYEGKISSALSPLKNHLGLLLTEPFYFSKMTGEEYIRMLCNARKKDPGNIAERNVFELPLNEYASTYSTGMKKKLAITAILLQQNTCFILDEPYNGVDIQSNILITEIIHLLKASGKIVIISSHIFSTLRDTCDEIYLLREGIFERKVQREDFEGLEREMKEVFVGDRISKLGI